MKNKTEEIRSTIEKWRKFGEDMYYLERYGEWIEFLKGTISGQTKKVNIDAILEAIKEIDINKDIEKAKEDLIKNTNPENYKTTLNAITVFSKNGPEFYSLIVNGKVPENVKHYLEYFKKQNEIYAKNEALRKMKKQKTKDGEIKDEKGKDL